MIPVSFVLLLLLIQPGIVLYDRIVMRDAAAQGCRVLATMTAGDDVDLDGYIRRRLGSVPQMDAFHVHGGECSWQIEWAGSAASDTVRVTIANEVEPLPLIGFCAALLGALDQNGHLVFQVQVSMPVQDAWVATSGAGSDPGSWIGAWLDD